MSDDTEALLLGAHCSAAGGVFNALTAAKSIGATTLQLFTANQKRWQGKALTPEVIDQWYKTLEDTGMREVMSHDSYLINLGAPSEEVLMKSRTAFEQEILRCQALGITYLNFHPGAALKEDRQQCLDRIVESLLLNESLLAEGKTRLLLEATAGQGSTLGCRFEELSYIIERVKDRLPIGVCIDTCHIFAAGYDLVGEEACRATLDEFEQVVGMQWLYALHLNDSLKECGSRVDRHRPLGEGAIGIEAFQYLMRDPRTRHLPKYLETPGGLELWKEEIKLLRTFAKR